MEIIEFIYNTTGAEPGEEGKPPLPFVKNKKSALILEKNTLIFFLRCSFKSI